MSGRPAGPDGPVPGAPRRREPVRTVAVARTPPKDRRPRPWTDGCVLRRLQGVEAWRDGLPESLAGSRTAELLEGVCDVDLDALDVKLPRGFGRD